MSQVTLVVSEGSVLRICPWCWSSVPSLSLCVRHRQHVLLLIVQRPGWHITDSESVLLYCSAVSCNLSSSSSSTDSLWRNEPFAKCPHSALHMSLPWQSPFTQHGLFLRCLQAHAAATSCRQEPHIQGQFPPPGNMLTQQMLSHGRLLHSKALHIKASCWSDLVFYFRLLLTPAHELLLSCKTESIEW